MNYKESFNNQFKESLQALEDTLNTLPKYQRATCKDCDYKLICAGECEKTIK